MESFDKNSEGIVVLSLFDGKYEVHSDGKVMSNVGTKKALIGKVTKAGYRMVLLTINNKKYYINVHRLVAENLIPNPNNLPEVNHIDGDKLNNSVQNLEWCSSKENKIHARDNGLQKFKIDMNIANEIRKLRGEKGYTHKELAEIFGIGSTQVGYIIQNKRWVI